MEQSARRTIKPFPSTFRQNGEPAYRLNGETGKQNAVPAKNGHGIRKTGDENYSVAVNTRRRRNSINNEPISGN